MSVVSRIDAYQRGHRWVGAPLAVLYKHLDDQGGYLAALIAYYGLLSLFPLLLLLSTVLGVVLAGHPELQQQVLSSALRDFPVIGPELGRPSQIGGGTVGLVVGGLGALYGGLGVANAVQNAMNTLWRVPRNNRPNPIKARLRGVVLLLIAGGSIVVTTVLSALGSGAGPLGTALRLGVLALSVVLNGLVFALVFRYATTRSVTLRQVAPGGIAAGILWQLLQSFGAAYVGHTVRNASATNAVFGVVLGLIAFLYVASVLIMLCAQANVVRVDHLYPRSLLTPLTDDVDLTEGDRRAYTEQAQAERSKGFETIEVGFER